MSENTGELCKTCGSPLLKNTNNNVPKKPTDDDCVERWEDTYEEHMKNLKILSNYLDSKTPYRINKQKAINDEKIEIVFGVIFWFVVCYYLFI